MGEKILLDNEALGHLPDAPTALGDEATVSLIGSLGLPLLMAHR